MEKRITKTNLITAGQIAFLLMAVLTVGKLFYLPALMYAETGRDSWLAGTILVVVNWAVLFLLYALMKKAGEKNLFDLLSSSFGRTVAKILLFVLAGFYILHFVVPVCEIYNFLNHVTMQKSNWIAFVLPLYFLVWFVAHKGLTVIGRNADLFAPLVFIAAALIFVFSLPAADIENILPVGITGAKSISLSVLRFSGWFSDCAVFLMLVGKSKNFSEKKGRAGLAISSALVSILLVCFFVLFPAVFGSTAPDQNFALVRVSEFGTSNFLGHADRAAVTIWLFGSLLKMCLLMYAAHECILQVFPSRKRSVRGGILAGLLGIAAVLPIIFKLDFVLKHMLGTVWFLIAAALLVLVLPAVLLCKKEKKDEK